MASSRLATERVRVERLRARSNGEVAEVLRADPGLLGDLEAHRKRERGRCTAGRRRPRPRPAGAQAAKTCFAASGSTWMFHSLTGVVLPAASERAAHEHPAAEQARERGLPLQREGEIRERPEGHEHELAGPASRQLDDPVRRVALRERPRRRGQLRVAEPRGPCVSVDVSSGRRSGCSLPR